MNAPFNEQLADIEKPLDDSGSTDNLNDFKQDLISLDSNDNQVKQHPVIVTYGNPVFNECLVAQSGAELKQQDISNYLVVPACLLGSDEPVNYCCIMPEQKPVYVYGNHSNYSQRGFIGFNLPAGQIPSYVYVVHEIEAAFKLSACKLPCVLIPPVTGDRKPIPIDNQVLQRSYKAIISALEAQGVQVYAPVATDDKGSLKTLLRGNKAHVLALPEAISQYIDNSIVTEHLLELKTLADQQAKKAILDSWREPKPITHELLPVQQLKREMLPADIAAYVYDVANRADNMPPDGVAACLLVTMCSVVGTRVGMRPKQCDSWVVIPNTWGAIVAPPSSKKSPAVDAALAPLNRLVADAKEAFNDAMKKQNVSEVIKKEETKALKSKLADACKKSDAAKKAEIAEELQAFEDEQAQVFEKRYMTDDGTIEAIVELEQINPNGILVKRDELTGWLSNLDKDPAARAFHLEGFNGNGSYQWDRVLRGTGYVESHCLSILGGIQPDKLIAYLEPSIKGLGNDGLMQRFQIMVYPDATAWKYRDSYPNKEARNSVYELFKKLDALSPNELVQIGANPADDLSKRPYFNFDDAAQALFMQWTTHLHTVIIANEERGIIVEHLQKYASLMPSLALLFHLIDGVQLGRIGRVSRQATEMAIEWCTYLETHARRIYGLVFDAADMKAATLGKKLVELKADHEWRIKGLTSREVHRKNWKGLTSIEAVHDALDILVDNHWLVVEEIEATVKGGRPSKLFLVNPKIYK